MSFKKLFTRFCLCCILLSLQQSYAAVRLPKIFSDNMVLQRDMPVKVWGWAEAGETVKIAFNGQALSVKADRKGRWSLQLRPMAYGGPYEMEVTGKGSTVVVSNVLIGDVWICSGQSNMSWELKNTTLAEEEIARAYLPKIRLFKVQNSGASAPEEDLAGGKWQVCSPETAEVFSAVAYYFGKNLQQELEVPIGLVNASWGGTIIEAWTNLEDLLQFEEFKKYKNMKPAKSRQSPEESAENWRRYTAALQHDKGMAEKWYESSADISGWKSMQLPVSFDSSGLGEANGIVWFSKEIELPQGLVGKEALLSLGIIDDKDETYVNGQLVGATAVWNIERAYKLRPDALKPGKNRITIKVTDNASIGGIRGEPSSMYLAIENQKISLTGEWKYKPSAISTDYNIEYFNPNAYPSQLYHAMIAPLHNFAIKGAIWYQGESNASRGYQYRKLFPALIKGWREKWGQDFPFIWVQLANYKTASVQPAESEWADLREAQSLSLQLPKTAQAVIIDVGEAGDIHPKNKKDVGKRLFLAALKVAYDQEVVYSGPVFKSLKVEGSKAVLSFTNIGSGLKAKDKYGYVKDLPLPVKTRSLYGQKRISRGIRWWCIAMK